MISPQYFQVLSRVEEISYLTNVVVPDWLDLGAPGAAEREEILGRLRSAKADIETAIGLVSKQKVA